MKTNPLTGYAITALCALAVGFLLALNINGCNQAETPVESVETRVHDTLIAYRVPPIRIDSAKPKIRYIPKIKYVDSIQRYTDTLFQPYYIDSLLITKPFIATLDTIVSKDTIKAQFQYPANLFSLSVNRGADSIHFSWIDTTKTVHVQPTFWDRLKDGALWFLGGLIVGGGVGIIISR